MTAFGWALDTSFSLIERFGQSVIHTQVARSGYDPTTDSEDTTPSTATIRAVVQPPGGPSTAYENGLRPMNRRVLKVSAKGLTLTPQVGDSFTFGGHVWKALSITEQAPDGTPLLYEITVER